MDSMIGRCYEDLPLPALIVSKKNGRLLYANTRAERSGLTRNKDFIRALSDKALAVADGGEARLSTALELGLDACTAELAAAPTDHEGEPALAVLVTRLTPMRLQNEGDVMLAVCEIFINGAKKPLHAFLGATARHAGAFYAALYEKSSGRYMIKGEWRSRRSVCIPILSADFDTQPERETARLRRLKSAADVVSVGYAKACGTQGVALYFFDQAADARLAGHLEKCVRLFKTFLSGKPQSPRSTAVKRGLESIGQGVALWDLDTTQLLYENKAYRELFGNGSARMISEQLRADLRAGARGFSEYTGTDGNSYSITHALARHGRQNIVTTLVTDVTKYKQAETRLEQMARTDALTGLLNRRAGLETVESLYEQCKANKEPLTVCFADIDGLKRVNDTRGHGVGDDMIRQVAGVLKNHVENKGCVCRLGGDEFVLMLPGHTGAQARMLAMRMERAVAKKRPVNGGISLSFGFTEARFTPEETAETLVSMADSDMYREKRKKLR